MRALRKMLPVYTVTILLVALCSMWASRVVPTFSEGPSRSASLPTVVLDPGHGGEDGGAISPNGVGESALNLEIGLRTRDLFYFLGIPVVMTRQTDVSIHSPEAVSISEKKVSDLKNRVKLVSETDNPILLSIHQNMFPQSKYSGAQVFYAETSGSQALAEAMQSRLAAGIDPANHRQAKPCQSVYLLEKIACPGILVECGFLSNPKEEALLQTAPYQKKLAAVLASCLTEALQP